MTCSIPPGALPSNANEYLRFNLISWSATANLTGDYSASISLTNEDNQYSPTIYLWQPVEVHMSSSAGYNSTSDVPASSIYTADRRHVWGLIDSVGKTEELSSSDVGLNVVSFITRLRKREVLYSPEKGATIQSAIDDILSNDLKIDSLLYDTSAIPTSFVFSNEPPTIEDDCALTAIRTLAQVACCECFINEYGKLVFEPWKDQTDAVDFVIPQKIIKNVSKDTNVGDGPSHVVVTGAALPEEDSNGGTKPPDEGGGGEGEGGGGGGGDNGGGGGKTKRCVLDGAGPGGVGDGIPPDGQTGAYTVGGSGEPSTQGSVKFKMGPPKEDATGILRGSGNESGNAWLLCTATTGQGVDGRRISIRLTDGTGEVVSVRGQSITVTLNSGSTGASVASAINGNAAASKLVTVGSYESSDGTGDVTLKEAFVQLTDYDKSGEGTFDYTYQLRYGSGGRRTRKKNSSSLGWRKAVAKTDATVNKLIANFRGQQPSNNVGGKKGAIKNPDTKRSSPATQEIYSGEAKDVGLVSEFGILTDEIQNEYIDNYEVCDAIALRRLQEVKMERNRWSLDLVYTPSIGVNDVVSFQSPLFNTTITGRVIDYNVDYSPSPEASVSVTVESFEELGSDQVRGSNLLRGSDLERFNSTGWDSKWGKASRASYQSATAAITTTGFTDSSADFVAEGFIEDQWVTITGAADNRNNANFKIASVTTTALTWRTHDTTVAESGVLLNIKNQRPPDEEYNRVRMVSGKAVFDVESGKTSYIEQAYTPLEAGLDYTLKYRLRKISGSGSMDVSFGPSSVSHASSGYYSLDATLSSATTVKFTCNGVSRWELTKLVLSKVSTI